MVKKLIYAFIFVSITGCVANANQHESMPPKEILDDIVLVSKVSGICSTYEKIFAYQQITGRSDDLDFARRFLTYAAQESGNTTEQLMDTCDKAFAASGKYRKIISEMK